MDTALEIAFGRMGLTSPNPAVGAVIVRDGTVVSIGGTGPCGSRHAEIAAIGAGGDVTGCDMYVSLEPCCHYGKTPPCTDAIIASGIKKVYAAILDPNPAVAGKGVARLRDSGIEVEIPGMLSQRAADLIRAFKKYILRKRTFVLAKSAVTLDGRIATRTGDSKWVSSEHSRYLVHRIRAKMDAVIIGKNTLLRDDPMLDSRPDSFSDGVKRYFLENRADVFGRDNQFLRSLLSSEISEYRQPLRVLVGLPGEVDFSRKFFRDDGYIVFERKDRLDHFLRNSTGLKSAVMRLNIVDIDARTNAEEIGLILEELADRGIMTAMLEGGGLLAGSFFDAGEIDQVIYFIAPKISGNGISPVIAAGKDEMGLSLPVRDVSVAFAGGDVLYLGYKDVYNFEMM
jgi:diaminohydroxyphosphoribosylaminopyrimidine deaminase/5-amino-6-(5-phosphoribosylamino)uracil reductase